MGSSTRRMICAAIGIIALTAAGAASAHDRRSWHDHPRWDSRDRWDDRRAWKERRRHEARKFSHRHGPRVVRERVVVIREPVYRERRIAHYEPLPLPPRRPAVVVSVDLPPLVIPLR